LEAFEASFSKLLRTPLDRSTGTLRAPMSSYDAATCEAVLPSSALTARERLAVYHRQYWFRLFNTLQDEYPTTTRVLGGWPFNALASRFLVAHPPKERDLARVADGFADYLEATLPTDGTSTRAVVQAARLDDAHREVFRAPEQPAFELAAAGAERVARERLVWSAAVRLLELDRPLTELRDAAGVDKERAQPLPAAFEEGPRWLVVCRTATGYARAWLEPQQAKLMLLLRDKPLVDALAHLEHEVPQEARAALARDTQRWLANGVRHGFWTGLEP
jgi:hypothetical protein